MRMDRAERIKWCSIRGYQIPLLGCLRCGRFPCTDMTAKDMDDLENSLFTIRKVSGLSERKTVMYIFRYSDGRLAVAPDGFYPENTDSAAAKTALEDVDEIYVVSKTLVKQLKLVVKDKAEITSIRSAKNKADIKK